MPWPLGSVSPWRYLPPSDFFTVMVAGEPVTIPYRIYNRERRRTPSVTKTEALILHCLYSRHHDGFVRQRHLRELLGHPEEWSAPFIMSLLGEYVLPIVQDIQAAVSTDAALRENLRRFADENPAFTDLTRQRAISYWNAYYRVQFIPDMTTYPDPAAYPGIATIAAIQAA